MKILGIETSAIVASAALFETDELSGKITAEYTINHKLNHSVTLMPMLDALVKQLDFDLKTLDYVAVASGPGSFTGLRIGSATAKGIAHGLNLDIIEVPTLLGMAYNIPYFNGYIVPMMDARRSQVYTGVYSFESGDVQQIVLDQAVAIEKLGDILTELPKKPIMLLGDGIKPNMDLIQTSFSELEILYAPAHLNGQRAGSICMAAWKKAKKGEHVPFRNHVPNYIRMSQAERELKERNSGNLPQNDGK